MLTNRPIQFYNSLEQYWNVEKGHNAQWHYMKLSKSPHDFYLDTDSPELVKTHTKYRLYTLITGRRFYLSIFPQNGHAVERTGQLYFVPNSAHASLVMLKPHESKELNPKRIPSQIHIVLDDHRINKTLGILQATTIEQIDRASWWYVK
jgi:hypothetical protein